jgi:hypothetical protein
LTYLARLLKQQKTDSFDLGGMLIPYKEYHYDDAFFTVIDEEHNKHIIAINLLSDSYSLNNGLSIGHTKEQVFELCGEPTFTDFDYSGAKVISYFSEEYMMGLFISARSRIVIEIQLYRAFDYIWCILTQVTAQIFLFSPNYCIIEYPLSICYNSIVLFV